MHWLSTFIISYMIIGCLIVLSCRVLYVYLRKRRPEWCEQYVATSFPEHYDPDLF